MIHVHFDPNNLTEEQKEFWETWRDKAHEATTQVISEWESYRQGGTTQPFRPDFNEKVWKELKEWLLVNVFHSKCAYCETPIVRATFHAEHFRPKGKVKYRRLGAKRMQTGMAKNEMAENESERSQEVEHPGYFWLAYHWKNLVPSCEFCNTAKGKKDQFPVENQYIAVKRVTQKDLPRLREAIIQSTTQNDVFYLQPDDLDSLEGRLLLHPYEDDPQKHLRFGESGIVTARGESEKGKHSIAVYDLAGSTLTKARAAEQSAVFTSYLFRIGNTPGTIVDKKQATEEFLAPYRKGEMPYSAAVLDYLRTVFRGSPFDPDKTIEMVIEELGNQSGLG